MMKQGMKKGTLLLTGLCTAVILLAGFRTAATAGASDSLMQTAVNDHTVAKAPLLASSDGSREMSSDPDGLQDALKRITAIGRSATSSDSSMRLVLKWQGEASDNEATEEAAQKLAVELGLGELLRTEEDGRSTLRSVDQGDAVHVTMFWSDLGGERSYCIVTFETADVLEAAELPASAELAGRKMIHAGIAAEWNVSLQGAAKEQGEPVNAVMAIEKAVSSELPGLSPVENYEDDTTYSRAYSVPGMKRMVTSGSHSVALQMAVHRNGTDDVNRVTLGFPVITIEY